MPDSSTCRGSRTGRTLNKFRSPRLPKGPAQERLPWELFHYTTRHTVAAQSLRKRDDLVSGRGSVNPMSIDRGGVLWYYPCLSSSYQRPLAGSLTPCYLSIVRPRPRFLIGTARPKMISKESSDDKRMLLPQQNGVIPRTGRWRQLRRDNKHYGDRDDSFAHGSMAGTSA